MLEFDETYPHSYQVEEVRELPGAGKLNAPLLYIPPPRTRTEHDGLWLSLTPASGNPWVGVFAFGCTSPHAFSRVVSSPNPDRALVVANGAGYLVSAADPQRWEEVPLRPVLDIRAIPERGLLLLSDFTRIAAYGSKGLVWRSPRLCWDELKITRVRGETIEGTGYDPTNSITNKSPFAVDIMSGRSLLAGRSSVDGKPVW